MEHAPGYHASEPELAPKALTRGMTLLVAAILAMTAVFVWTGQPKDATPPVSDVVVQRSLVIDGTMSGAARVTTADGTLVAEYTPQTGGFVAGIARVLERERTKAQVALGGPVTLTAHENGRLSLTDPSTGWSADLMGFGQDNHAVFARLLTQGAAQAPQDEGN